MSRLRGLVFSGLQRAGGSPPASRTGDHDLDQLFDAANAEADSAPGPRLDADSVLHVVFNSPARATEPLGTEDARSLQDHISSEGLEHLRRLVEQRKPPGTHTTIQSWFDEDDWFDGDDADEALNAIQAMIGFGVQAFPPLAEDLIHADEHPLLRAQFEPIWDKLMQMAELPAPECLTPFGLRYLTLALMKLGHPNWSPATHIAVSYVVFRLAATAYGGYGYGYRFEHMERDIAQLQASSKMFAEQPEGPQKSGCTA